jgi:hypothetical protein
VKTSRLLAAQIPSSLAEPRTSRQHTGSQQRIECPYIQAITDLMMGRLAGPKAVYGASRLGSSSLEWTWSGPLF